MRVMRWRGDDYFGVRWYGFRVLGMNGWGVRISNAGISNLWMHKIIRGKYCYGVNVPSMKKV